MSDPERLERLGVGVLGALAIAISCYSTSARYFFPSSVPDWGEELVVYLSVWALWLSVGRLVRRNEHVRAEVLVQVVPRVVQRWLEALHGAVGLIFCAAMGWAGMEVVKLSVAITERGESSLHIPLAVYYAGMPIGMGLMMWGYGRRLWCAVRGSGAVTEGA